MKKLIVWSLALIPAMGWAQSNNFTIKVKAGELNAPAKAYFFYRSGDSTIKDSASISNGVVQFHGSVSEPTRADLIIDRHGIGWHKMRPTNADPFSFYVEKGTIVITAKDSVKSAAITGSPVSDEYLKYKKLVASQATRMEAIGTEYSKAPDAKKKDTVFTNGLTASYNRAMDEVKVIDERYIKANPDSYVSLTLMSEIIGGDMNVAKVEPIFKGLSARMQNTEAGKQIAKLIIAAHSTAIGATAPVFTQNDTSGKAVKLTDYRGKYVLVDFWASWCGPCREENPNYVKAYHHYKDKNFTILGISLDQPGKKEAWLAAIKKDGLEWTQVSDLKFWNNEVAKLYGIKAIPQNFLVDPAGKIVATNLRGEDLNKKLKELFGE